PATPEIYTLSLHDALPISQLHSRREDPGGFLLHRFREGTGGPAALRPSFSRGRPGGRLLGPHPAGGGPGAHAPAFGAPHARPVADRKSTRLNSSHVSISYA